MTGTVPPERGGTPIVASRTWQMIADEPYRYTSGDVIFTAYAERAGIAPNDRPAVREQYYSVGRACLRSSDLRKRSGWDVHADAEGRVADYAVGSRDCGALAAGATPDGEAVALTRAMRSKIAWARERNAPVRAWARERDAPVRAWARGAQCTCLRLGAGVQCTCSRQGGWENAQRGSE